MSYGIPRAILPIDHDGRVEVDDFRKWLASLQASDNVSSVTIDAMHGESLGVVVYPDEKDVLLGRGKRVEGSAGNLLLKRIIEKNSDRYEKASRFEKISVAQAVFLRMKQGGSRFLKKDGSNWIEVVDSVARDKIGHAFRNQKARSPTPHIPSATEVGDTPIPPAKRPWYHLG